MLSFLWFPYSVSLTPPPHHPHTYTHTPLCPPSPPPLDNIFLFAEAKENKTKKKPKKILPTTTTTTPFSPHLITHLHTLQLPSTPPPLFPFPLPLFPYSKKKTPKPPSHPSLPPSSSFGLFGCYTVADHSELHAIPSCAFHTPPLPSTPRLPRSSWDLSTLRLPTPPFPSPLCFCGLSFGHNVSGHKLF